ncbi:MAG TPA: hypothetical protein VIL09_16565 [Microvirga sp.]|jgi:hypothetical protein
MRRLSLMLPLFAAVIAMASTGIAFAQACPNAATARTGFMLERQGTRTEVRPASDLFTHAANVYSGGRRQDVLYFRGLIAVSRISSDAQAITVPLTDLRQVFPLDVGAKRALVYVSTEPGKAGRPTSVEITVPGRESLRIGGCTYEVIVVRNRILAPDGRLVSQHADLYAPDLGFVIGRRYDDGGRETLVTYETIRPLERSGPL